MEIIQRFSLDALRQRGDGADQRETIERGVFAYFFISHLVGSSQSFAFVRNKLCWC